MKEQIILFFFSVSFLVSCGQINKLSEEDYKWMPYKGNETLVFKSNTGSIDTIFIIKKDTLLAYPEAQALHGIKYEAVSVLCRHYSLDKQEIRRSYYLFKVQKAKDKRTEIVMDLSARDAVFYNLSPLKTDSLSKEKPGTLQTPVGQYDDIYIIYPDDYARDFYNRSNYVTKLYWSKSQGLVRYDKKDSIYWELQKRY